jgi:CheY-like chemotaxis protein
MAVWLLVEDDSDIRNIVAMMMTVWGEKPLPFPDGKTAWLWLDTVENGTFTGELPELALMDIRMPGYRGDQIAARIRSLEPLKNIPIILMTAFTMSETEVNTLREQCGIDHLLNKPLPDMDSFRTLLYKVRDERKAKPVSRTNGEVQKPPSDGLVGSQEYGYYTWQMIYRRCRP